MKPTTPGRPKFAPTSTQRAQVTALIACGTRRALVAKYLGIDGKTLAKHFKKEVQEAASDANAAIAQTLYQKAQSGDTVCMLFWLKCRAGWKEGSRHELTGLDGRPLLAPQLPLGISFADGGPGRVRRVPYDMEKDMARISKLPPGADYLGDQDEDEPSALDAPVPSPPAIEEVPATNDNKSMWEVLGMSKDEFDKR